MFSERSVLATDVNGARGKSLVRIFNMSQSGTSEEHALSLSWASEAQQEEGVHKLSRDSI